MIRLYCLCNENTCSCRTAFFLTSPAYKSSTSSSNLTIRSAANILRLRKNGRNFADDIFKCTSSKCISLIHISLYYFPNVLLHNMQVLILVMAWNQIVTKPLPVTMIIQSTHFHTSPGLNGLNSVACTFHVELSCVLDQTFNTHRCDILVKLKLLVLSSWSSMRSLKSMDR